MAHIITQCYESEGKSSLPIQDIIKSKPLVVSLNTSMFNMSGNLYVRLRQILQTRHGVTQRGLVPTLFTITGRHQNITTTNRGVHWLGFTQVSVYVKLHLDKVSSFCIAVKQRQLLSAPNRQPFNTREQMPTAHHN